MTVLAVVRECRDVLLRLPDPLPSYRLGGQCDECGMSCRGVVELVDHYEYEHGTRANSRSTEFAGRQGSDG